MIVTHRTVQHLIQRAVTSACDDARFLAPHLCLLGELHS